MERKIHSQYLILVICIMLFFTICPQAAFAWPPGHPEGAASAKFIDYGGDSFNVFIWREDGQLYIEIAPDSDPAYTCLWTIIQNDIAYYNILLRKQSGSAKKCGDIPIVSTVYALDVPGLKLFDEFIFIYTSGPSDQSLVVPADSHSPEPPPPDEPDEPDEDSDNSSSGCFIKSILK